MDEQEMPQIPEVGSIWRHYKHGHLYEVVLVETGHPDGEVRVCYQRVEEDARAARPFSQPLTRWHAPVDGAYMTPRFVRMSGPPPADMGVDTLELAQLAADCPAGGLILEEMAQLTRMLLEKNLAYGNSALTPVRIFSSADPIEQIKVRLDDKLSRLARGQAAGEDVELDLLGYLVLLRVARLMEADEQGARLP